ncbi:MAG: DUF4142 domain-containing protein [Pseudomonas sp.]|nr:DUF4142 domain-containing protein [Pseudomonas sp.]
MKPLQTLTGALAVVLFSFGTMPALADDDTMTGTDMGQTTRTPGPTGTPATTGQGGSASREGLVTEPNYPKGITAAEFIEDASQKNLAIINAAQLALEADTDEAGDPDLQKFARQMIDEHEGLNRKMKELAEQEQLEVADSAMLVDQAQRMVLDVREDESFRQAYANNQIADHHALIDLFKRAAASDHGTLSRFAEDALPKLKKHLELARQLNSDQDTD